MTIPEWVAIIFATVVCAVIGWGVTRLVKAIDDAIASLKEIDERLDAISISHGKSAMWMTMHEDSDNRRFGEVKERIVDLAERVTNRH